MTEYLQLTKPLVTEVATLIAQAAQHTPDALVTQLQALAAARYQAEFLRNGGDERDAAFDAGRDIQVFSVHLTTWLSKLSQ